MGNSHKKAARELSARTGIQHSMALDTTALALTSRNPRDRWVLSDDVRAFFAGDGWYGGGFHNLYDWLDNEVKTRFECDRCYELCDARTEDASIEPVVVAYDPDVVPSIQWIKTHKYHARCQGSRVNWRVPSEKNFSARYEIKLPAEHHPDLIGSYAIAALPFTFHEDPDALPALILTAEVTDDQGQGPDAWISELESHLRDNGFGPLDSQPLDGFDEQSTAAGETDSWSLRIVAPPSPETPHDIDKALDPEENTRRTPHWLALRQTAPAPGVQPEHLFLGKLRDPRDGCADYNTWERDWFHQVRQSGRVLVYFGPLPHTLEPEDLDNLDKAYSHAIEELLGDGDGFIVREVVLDTSSDDGREGEPVEIIEVWG